MAEFIDVLQQGYMQRAIMAGLLVGVTCPAIGLYLVLRRLSLIGDGFGHLSFAGVAAGWLWGIYPLFTAAAFAMLGAIVIEKLRTWRREYSDLALAIVFYSGIALGVVFAGLSRHLNVNLLGYLFGSILTVSDFDLLVIGGASILVLATLSLLEKEFFALAYDEDGARVAGLPVTVLNHLVLLLAALTVVAALRVVGIVLVAGLLVIPVAASLQLGRGFRGTRTWAMVFGGGSALLGLMASYLLDIAPGGTIILTSILVFIVAGAAREIAGLVQRRA
ncbi:MAG: metal ABC transporter permease [Dehalococcoidia bacterium]|nr:metal ABC transporter permease [Dehalococcoidia bacterium]